MPVPELQCFSLMSSTSVWRQALQSDVRHQSGTKCSSLMSNTSVWHQVPQSDVKHFSLTPSASVWCQTIQSDTKCFSLMSNTSVWNKYYSWIQRTSFWCQWKSFSLVPMQQSRAMWQNSPWLKTQEAKLYSCTYWKSHTFPKLKITHISNTALNISHSTLPLFQLSL